jgi:type II secretory pathway pseudopilin PulG
MTSKVARLEMDLMERPIPIGNMRWLSMGAHQQRGFTFIGVLVIMAVMLIALGAVSQVWHVVMQQEKEQELLFIGHQFRTAIGKYYTQSGNKYPLNLETLLETNDRSGRKVHYLRKIYPDPMTGESQWGLVLAQGGGLAGVYSFSEDKPFKIAGFINADSLFESAEKYSDWKFVYRPTVIRAQVGIGVGTVINGFVRPLPRTK